ncbi:YggW family oxidoreductase, partial [Francisella tularensis subsp. holarctica]|nr:YggW family oxidoreductase [Francisella tularensis subsp. holarctica]
SEFEQKTFLSSNIISKKLQLGIDKGLLELNANQIKPTAKGYLFLNDCINIFS